jgi:hypothetical protein
MTAVHIIAETDANSVPMYVIDSPWWTPLVCDQMATRADKQDIRAEKSRYQEDKDAARLLLRMARTFRWGTATIIERQRARNTSYRLEIRIGRE